MSLQYTTPLEDMKFCLKDLLQVDKDWERLGFHGLDLDTAVAVSEAAGVFCSEVLSPLNASGDKQGCQLLPDGTVKTPDGYKEAFDQYRQQGWSALACDTTHGGQGLPQTIQAAFNEMQASTCQAFGMYPLLSLGAYDCILKNGSDEVKQLFLPHLASGLWTGTMCLTEPQCGTDLGLVRTSAQPIDEQHYALSGTKIFISSGEHDLSENIIHLVLARLPDAPKGTKGLTLFACPKFNINTQGQLSNRNALRCTRIEEKMGIHGNSTCEMLFEGALGYLVGEKNQGLKAMFVMMNGARLGVAMQGLGISEASLQAATTYAKDRLQSRALKQPLFPNLAADPIYVHPDVQRMLLTIRARSEAGRMLSYWAAHLSDISHHEVDEEKRKNSLAQLGILTPICKARLTDAGFESANLAMQIYGGHGFIRDHGVEQLVRDSRINMIYEGTNGIQALDLVSRKILPDQGKALRDLLAPIFLFCEETCSDTQNEKLRTTLKKALEAFQTSMIQVGIKALSDPNEAASGAHDFLHALACLLEGYLFIKAANILSNQNTPFALRKKALADFYFDKLFSEFTMRLKNLSSGYTSLAAVNPSWLGLS